MKNSLIEFVDLQVHPNPAHAKDSLELLQIHLQVCGITPYGNGFELADKSVIGQTEHQDNLILWAQKNCVPRRLLGKRELGAAYRVLGRQLPNYQFTY